MSWKDKSQVNFISNQFANSTVIVQRRQNGQQQKTDKIIPEVAQDYSQKGMGHVDQYDASLQI